jgi:hypothetical protein
MTDDTPPEYPPLTFLQQVAIAQRLPLIADFIAAELQQATGGTPVAFSLLTWGHGRTQYIANASRTEIKAGMRELLDRWDKPGEDLGVPTMKDVQ